MSLVVPPSQHADKIEETSIQFRTNSIERKDAWCRLITWMQSTIHLKPDGKSAKRLMVPAELRVLPAPDLRKEDAQRCVNNPALIDVPFKSARELIYNMARFNIFAVDRLVQSKDEMLYTLFQLEMYAWKKPKADSFYQQETKPDGELAYLPACLPVCLPVCLLHRARATES